MFEKRISLYLVMLGLIISFLSFVNTEDSCTDDLECTDSDCDAVVEGIPEGEDSSFFIKGNVAYQYPGYNPLFYYWDRCAPWGANHELTNPNPNLLVEYRCKQTGDKETSLKGYYDVKICANGCFDGACLLNPGYSFILNPADNYVWTEKKSKEGMVYVDCRAFNKEGIEFISVDVSGFPEGADPFFPYNAAFSFIQTKTCDGSKYCDFRFVKTDDEIDSLNSMSGTPGFWGAVPGSLLIKCYPSDVNGGTVNGESKEILVDTSCEGLEYCPPSVDIEVISGPGEDSFFIAKINARANNEILKNIGFSVTKNNIEIINKKIECPDVECTHYEYIMGDSTGADVVWVITANAYTENCDMGTRSVEF